MNFIRSNILSYRIITLALLAISMSLSACSKKKYSDDVIPAELLYNSGVELLEKGDYQKASDEFENVFFQHPGNEIAPKSELMQAYSLYMAGEYDLAVDILDIFIKLHPRHEEIAYAYYMKGLANYTQISSVDLDQSRSKTAKYDFETVVKRFPDTKYATDASLKLDLVDNHLAGKEMYVGRYYLNQKNPISAIRRFQTVINEYPYTTHSEEALYRMVESNIMLGLKEEAIKYAAVLGHNYPEGIWYKRAYELVS